MTPRETFAWLACAGGWIMTFAMFFGWSGARQGWATALRGWLAALGDTDHEGNDRRGIIELTFRITSWRER